MGIITEEPRRRHSPAVSTTLEPLNASDHFSAPIQSALILLSSSSQLTLTKNNLVFEERYPNKITKTIPVENVDSYSIVAKNHPKALSWSIAFVIGSIAISAFDLITTPEWRIASQIGSFVIGLICFFVWKYDRTVDLVVHSVSSKTQIAMTLAERKHQEVLSFFDEFEKTKATKRRS